MLNAELGQKPPGGEGRVPDTARGSLKGSICRLFIPRGLPYAGWRRLPRIADRDVNPTLLIVDDEKPTREGLRAALEQHYDVYLAEDAKAAMELLEKDHFDVLLTDFRLPTEDGMKLIARAKSLSKPPICILMTAYGSEELAVEAMKRGADDYIAKGRLQIDELEVRIANALRRQNLEAENVSLHQQLEARFGLQNLVGESPAMKEVLEVVQQVAPTRATVLLLGESGTGKEMVAKVIHQLSPRAQQPMVTVHCAALAPTLLESELFGHEKGAFTGAYERRIGRFEQAQGGTLFLDEIGDMPIEAQTRLLRVLQEGEYTTVGGRARLRADVRIIAATHRDLKQLVRQGLFREDLFYRLNVVPIRLPPLRERTEDIPALARHFLTQCAKEGLPSKVLDPAAVERLKAYRWPGNVRELENMIQRIVALYSQEVVGVDVIEAELGDVGPPPEPETPPLDDSLGSAAERHLKAYFAAHRDGLPAAGLYDRVLREIERPLITLSLSATRGNQIKAAHLLGLNRNTLRKKIRELDIQVVRGLK